MIDPSADTLGLIATLIASLLAALAVIGTAVYQQHQGARLRAAETGRAEAQMTLARAQESWAEVKRLLAYAQALEQRIDSLEQHEKENTELKQKIYQLTIKIEHLEQDRAGLKRQLAVLQSYLRRVDRWIESLPAGLAQNAPQKLEDTIGHEPTV